jgi:hypothetical protein
MAKKENNKRSYDLNRKWQERKKKRNAEKGKQKFVVGIDHSDSVTIQKSWIREN